MVTLQRECLWDMAILHVVDMTQQTQPALSEQGEHAWKVGLGQDLSIGHPVLPRDWSWLLTGISTKIVALVFTYDRPLGVLSKMVHFGHIPVAGHLGFPAMRGYSGACTKTYCFHVFTK